MRSPSSWLDRGGNDDAEERPTSGPRAARPTLAEPACLLHGTCLAPHRWRTAATLAAATRRDYFCLFFFCDAVLEGVGAAGLRTCDWR